MPIDLHAVLARALAPDPGDRYAHAGAFEADLQRHLDGHPVDALPSRLGRLQAWFGRRRHRVARVAAGVAMLGVAGVFTAAAAVHLPRMEREERAMAGLRGVQAAVANADEAGSDDRFLRFVRSDVLGTDALSEAWAWHAELGRDHRVTDLAAAWATAVSPGRRRAATVALAEALLVDERWDAFVRVVQAGGPLDRPDLEAHAARLRWDLSGTPWLATMGALVALPPGVTNGVLLEDGGFLRVDGTAVERLDATGAPVAWATLPGPAETLIAGEGAAWVRVGRTLQRVALPDLTVSTALEATFEIGKFVLADVEGKGTRAIHLQAPYPLRDVFRVDRGALVQIDPALVRAQLDINAFVAADLDGDGADALVMSSAGWKTRDLRVWERGRTAARIRLKGGAMGVGGLAAGAPWIAAMVGDPSDKELLDLAIFDVGLRLLFRQTLPTRMEHVWVADLDGDGADDLLLNRRQDPFRAVYVARGGPGPSFSSPVPLPELQVVDARGGRVWWSDGARAWVSGAGGREVLPPRTVSEAKPVQEMSAFELPVPVGVAWERFEVLAGAGLAVESARGLSWLGAVAPPRASTAILARALALLPSQEALDVARTLADGRPIDDAVAREVAEVLGASHAFEGMPRVGPWADVVEALQVEERFGFEGPIDPRINIERPESARRMALAPGLAIRATGDRDTLLTLPLVWDGRALEVVADLSLDTVDWASGVELVLDTGGKDAPFVLARGGGGPTARHRLSVFCGDTNLADMAWVDRPATLRVHLTRLPGATGCALKGFGRAVVPGPAGSGPVRLQLRTHRHKGWDDGAVLGVLRTVIVRGATVGPGAPGGEEARRFASGDPEVSARLARLGPPLLAALARAELGEDPSAALLAASERDLRFLIRTNPDRWLAEVRRLFPDRFVRLVAEAWDKALAYDESEPLGRSAALAGLPLDGEAGRRLALARVRGLLDMEGGRLEAESLLARLRSGPDPGEAWSLTARLRLRSGDREGATEAIRAWIAASGAVAEDRVFDDPELTAAAPEGLVAAPQYQRAGGSQGSAAGKRTSSSP